MSNSVSNCHKKALSLIFNENFFTNFIKFIFGMLVMIICKATVFLMPLSSLLKVKICQSIIDNKKLNLTEILKDISFNPSQFFSMLIVLSLKLVILIAGFILFFIPGLILALVFAPVDYLININTDISVYNTLIKSTEITKGKKSKLFWIYALPILIILILLLLQSLVMFFAPMSPILYILVGIIVILGILLALMEMYLAGFMFIREISQENQQEDITATDTETIFSETSNN